MQEKAIRITEKLIFDRRRQLILWNGRAIRYRVALRFLLPSPEVDALCAYFHANTDKIEEQFRLQ